MRMLHTARVISVAYLVLALSACASHGNLVRCEGRLEPINTPTPRPVQAVVPGSSHSDDERSDRE
jgi:hypothetical protein